MDFIYRSLLIPCWQQKRWRTPGLANSPCPATHILVIFHCVKNCGGRRKIFPEASNAFVKIHQLEKRLGDYERNNHTCLSQIQFTHNSSWNICSERQAWYYFCRLERYGRKYLFGMITFLLLPLTGKVCASDGRHMCLLKDSIS